MNKKESNNIEIIENKITKDKILFFDLDGTLIETDYSNFLAYNKAVNSVLNKNITYNPNERFTRKKLITTFPNLTKTEIKAIIEKKEMYYKDYLQETKLIKTAYTILKRYYQTNRTFLVTNCRKNRAFILLNYYNLTEKFEKIFYRQFNNDIKVNKFKNAILDLNVSPQQITVFENEQTEIIDAIDAGIPKENIIAINK